MLLAKAQEALRQSEARYRYILETTNEGVWLLDAENKAIASQFADSHGRDFKVIPAQEALQRGHVERAEECVDGNFMRLWTHRNGTDCFFAAIWQRT